MSLHKTEDTISTQRTTGMFRRTGSAQWQQRITIPKWARLLYDGKAFVRVSLETTDASEARRKSLTLQADWADRFEGQRHLVAPPTLTGMTTEMRAYLCAAVRHRILDADDNVRFEPKAVLALLCAYEGVVPPFRFLTARDAKPAYLVDCNSNGLTFAQIERLKVIESALSRHLKTDLAVGGTAIARAFADAEAKRLGLAFDWSVNRPALLSIARAVVSAYLEAARRTYGDPVDTPALPVVPEAALAARQDAMPAMHAPRSIRTLNDIVTEWKVARKARPDAVAKTERAIDLLEASGESIALPSLTKATGLRWRNWLIDDARPFGATTAGKHMQAISALLNFATDEMEGWLDRNPWKGIEVPKGRKAKRIPWDIETLTQLFASPLHQAYELPEDPRASGAAAYWLPLLGIYTGARLAELCSLRLVDVVERDKVLLLDITDDSGQIKKTDAGVRNVPVHSELLRLGFGDYVRDRQGSGAASLFDMYIQPSRSGPTYFSDWFRRLRTGQGCSRRWQDFHAMRTTVSTKLRGVHPAINESLILALLGHEGNNTGQTHYTIHDPTALQRAMECLEFTGLLLPRVYPVNFTC